MSPKSIIIGMILILAACLSTALMLHYNKEKHSGSLKKKQQKDPNLIVLNASFRNYNSNGLVSSFMSAPKVIHYPEKNTTVMVKPKLKVYTKKRIPWYIDADNGLANKGNKVITLWGHVTMHQPGQAGSPKTTITTSKITFYPKRSYADTDQLVTIVRPGTKLQSKGMTVNFKTGVLTTKSQTRGTYDVNSH